MKASVVADLLELVAIVIAGVRRTSEAAEASAMKPLEVVRLANLCSDVQVRFGGGDANSLKEAGYDIGMLSAKEQTLLAALQDKCWRPSAEEPDPSPPGIATDVEWICANEISKLLADARDFAFSSLDHVDLVALLKLALSLPVPPPDVGGQFDLSVLADDELAFVEWAQLKCRGEIPRTQEFSWSPPKSRRYPGIVPWSERPVGPDDAPTSG